MRTDVSQAFLQAEAQSIAQYTARVVLRPDPEALDWQTQYTGIGRSDEHAIDKRQDAGMCCVTPAGTLLRTYGSAGASVPTPTIYVNRVTAGQALSPAAFQSWSAAATGIANITREAISADTTRVRLFFVRSGVGISYVDSTNDGVSWSAPVTLSPNSQATNGFWSVTALASPRPDLLFACRSLAQGSTQWLEVTAFRQVGGTWEMTRHPKSTKRMSLQQTAVDFWDAFTQFDAALLDPATGRCVVALIDNLAGRPAATVFDRRHWSDFVSVEAIDFSEPERDEVIALRCQRIGNKVLLAGRRSMGDSDWMTTRQGVLYYTLDGLRWSEGYYICEGQDYPFGTPVWWRNALWLVGHDRIMRADPTPLFGGVAPYELDVTASVKSVEIDVPEDGSPQDVTIVLDNQERQWLSHPLLREGTEVEVFAGYAGTEQISIFKGKLLPPTPTTSEDGESEVTLPAMDYTANFTDGKADRLLEYPSPYRRAVLLTTEDDLRAFGTHGEWRHVEEDGGFARATKKGWNSLTLSSGLAGNLTASARLRLHNPFGPTALTEVHLITALSADWRYRYVLKCGANIQGWELWKVVPHPTNGTEMLTLLGSLAAVGDYTPDGRWIPPVPVNQWFRLQVQQAEHVIIASMQFSDDQNSFELFRVFDPTPINLHGNIAIGAVLPDDMQRPTDGSAPPPWASVDVDDVRVIGHHPETTVEEFLYGLAVQKGFETLEAQAQLDHTFATQGLTGWTAFGNGAWSTDAQGLTYTANNSSKSYLRSDVVAEDFSIDVDMTLGSGAANAGERFGIAARIGGDGSFVALNLGAYWWQGRLDTAIGVQVVNASGFLDYYTYSPSLVPVYPGMRARFRFVVQGPWYSIYCNDALCGTFYVPLLVRPGYVGLAREGGHHTTYDTIRVHRVRMPMLDVATMPIIKPGDSLDRALSELLEAQNGWMQAEGRTLRIGVQLPLHVAGTLDNSVILDGGYSINYDHPPSHCRVISTTPDGEEISGHTYAIEYAKRGRPRWLIEEVEGLRTAQECRDRAWQFLLDADRAARTRPYTIQPRLRLQQYDLLEVTNVHDDTIARRLYLVGMNRSIEREVETGAISVRMTARLEEQNATRLTRATEVQAT